MSARVCCAAVPTGTASRCLSAWRRRVRSGCSRASAQKPSSARASATVRLGSWRPACANCVNEYEPW
eukprot:4770018-Alexandrium_andersonii.AAC.1